MRARTFCCFTLLFYAGSNAQHRLPLSLTHTLTLTSSYILCHIIIHTMSHNQVPKGAKSSPSLTHTHSHPLSLSHTLPPSLPLSLSLSLTHTLSLSLSLLLSLSLTHSLSLTLSHTHTRKNTPRYFTWGRTLKSTSRRQMRKTTTALMTSAATICGPSTTTLPFGS